MKSDVAKACVPVFNLETFEKILDEMKERKIPATKETVMAIFIAAEKLGFSVTCKGDANIQLAVLRLIKKKFLPPYPRRLFRVN